MEFVMTLGVISLLLGVMREHQRSEEIARDGFLTVQYLTRTNVIHSQLSPDMGVRLPLAIIPLKL